MNITQALPRRSALHYPRHLAGTALLCLAEARPTVLVIFLMRLLTGAAVGGYVAGRAEPARVVWLTVAWGLGVFAVYLYNGVTDVREDRLNGSRRPIARGDLDPDTARTVALQAGFLSMVIGLALSGSAPWLVLAMLALGYAYSGRPFSLKNHTTGTAVVSTAGGLLTYYAGFSSHGVEAVRDLSVIGTALPMFAVLMSLWMGLVGAPAKDLSDVHGDAAAGRRTLAVVYSARTAGSVVALNALAISAIFLALAMRHPILAGPAAAVTCGTVAIWGFASRGLGDGDRSQRRMFYRAFMVTQYLAHAILMVSIGVDSMLTNW